MSSEAKKFIWFVLIGDIIAFAVGAWLTNIGVWK
jgi:hypothetical protein